MPKAVQSRTPPRRRWAWLAVGLAMGCPGPDTPIIRPSEDSSSSGNGSGGAASEGSSSTGDGAEPQRIPPEPWVLPEGCGDGVIVAGQYDCFFPVSIDWVQAELGDGGHTEWTGLDLEGDGRSEILFVQKSKQTTVLRWEDGALVLGPSASFSSLHGGYRTSTEWDWDRDGRRDLTVLNAGGGAITMHRNLGKVGLAERTVIANFPTSEWPKGDGVLAPLDVDGDGILEIIRSTQVNDLESSNPDNELFVLKAVGDDWVQHGPSHPFGRCGWLWRAAYGDFDEDGDMDIAILDNLEGCDPFPSSYDPDWYRVGVYLPNSGSGELDLGGSYPIGERVREGNDSMWSDDIDGDGHLDLVVQVYWVVEHPDFAYAVTVLHGRGDGTFEDGAVIELGPTLPSYSIRGRGDFDGDGVPEWITRHEGRLWAIPLAFASAGISALVALHDVDLGGTTSFKAAVGDVNGDGIDDYIGRSVTTSDPGSLGEGDFLMVSSP